MAAVALAARASEPAPPAPQALTTEYAVNPLGIGEPRPRLAWKLRFPERGAVQRACQIQAAATPDKLEALRSGQRVVWRVRLERRRRRRIPVAV